MMPEANHQELYQHPRLTTPRSIRVISLYPSPDFSAPLQANLIEVCIDELSLSYEALSYVWGSPTGNHPLQCHGRQLFITANCDMALRYLRSPQESRVLWVDAVCIDQGENEDSIRERNLQVAMMGEVYSGATRT